MTYVEISSPLGQDFILLHARGSPSMPEGDPQSITNVSYMPIYCDNRPAEFTEVGRPYPVSTGAVMNRPSCCYEMQCAVGATHLLIYAVSIGTPLLITLAFNIDCGSPCSGGRPAVDNQPPLNADWFLYLTHENPKSGSPLPLPIDEDYKSRILLRQGGRPAFDNQPTSMPPDFDNQHAETQRLGRPYSLPTGQG